MKPVQGYMAEDGTFFASKKAARLHDAEMAIRAYCVTHNVDAEKCLDVLGDLGDTAKEYIDAFKAIQNTTTPKVSIDQANPEIQDELSSLLEQPSRRDEPVPNVRRRTQSEDV